MKFNTAYLLYLSLFITVITSQTLEARVVKVASKEAVKIALNNGFSSLPTNEQMVAARNAYIKKAPKNCKIGDILLMTTPWGKTPEEVNKVFIISKCSYSSGPHPKISYAAALKYDYITSSYKFEGIFLPGVAREKNATGSLLWEIDLKYLLGGWIIRARDEDNDNDTEVEYVDVGGIIKDQQGNPISDVVIRLLFPHLTFEQWQSENYPSDGIMFNSFSDDNGNFSFELPLARNLKYTIIIMKIGYKPIVKKNLMITTQKSPVILRINLEKK